MPLTRYCTVGRLCARDQKYLIPLNSAVAIEGVPSKWIPYQHSGDILAGTKGRGVFLTS